MFDDYYNYKEIRAAALKPDATFKEKERLARWFDNTGTGWNGEEYQIDADYRMRPVYEPDPEDPDDFIIVDYEIK